MFPIIAADDISRVYSSIQQANSLMGMLPGTLRQTADGLSTVMLIRNNHTSDLAVGDIVSSDYLTNDVPYDVKRPATADLDRLAGVAAGAIPASGGVGWIIVRGYAATVKVDGSGVNVAAGDSIKGQNGSTKGLHDQAAGTTSAFRRRLIALDPVTTDSTTDAIVECL